MSTNPASIKQVNFIQSLFADAEKGFTLAAEQGRDDIVATLTAKVATVQSTLVNVVGGVPIDKRDASLVINVLKDVTDSLRSLVLAATLPGLARFNPEFTMVNKLAKVCHVCNASVGVGDGHAIRARGSWLTFCTTCANETDEDREARVAAEREALAADLAAQRAAAEAEWAERDRLMREHRLAEQNHRAYVEAFAIDLFDRAGASDAAKPDIHVAIPSATSNNDLDFFRVVRADNTTKVYRVIGGHNDKRLPLAQAEAAMLALVLTEDIPAAMATYGREIGRCGYCHRRLTNKASRAIGLGPDCAAKYGW